MPGSLNSLHSSSTAARRLPSLSTVSSSCSKINRRPCVERSTGAWGCKVCATVAFALALCRQLQACCVADLPLEHTGSLSWLSCGPALAHQSQQGADVSVMRRSHRCCHAPRLHQHAATRPHSTAHDRRTAPHLQVRQHRQQHLGHCLVELQPGRGGIEPRSAQCHACFPPDPACALDGARQRCSEGQRPGSAAAPPAVCFSQKCTGDWWSTRNADVRHFCLQLP